MSTDVNLPAPGWSEEEFEKTLAEVTRLASRDDEFRALALRDPREALEEVTSKPLPEGFVLRFVDNAGANLTVVLPDLVPESELSDEELEAVAGGGVIDVNIPIGPIGPIVIGGGGGGTRERERLRERVRERERTRTRTQTPKAGISL